MDAIGKAGSRIAHLSTFPPLRCGIASFTSDLIEAMPGFDHRRYALHYGSVGDCSVSADANVTNPGELANLARLISSSDCDVVSLQHEFGIWGGTEGEHIHTFLDNLSKPVVSVLHTTFAAGVRTVLQEQIIERLVQESVAVVALTELSKATTERLLGRPIPHMRVIPHGIPRSDFVAPPARWEGLGSPAQPIRLVTPGFLRPSKGFEEALHALRELRRRGYHVFYLIAGEPQQQFGDHAPYRERVESLVQSLNLQDVVHLDCRYLSVSEQIEAIRASHCGLFTYQDHALASSGTVPLVMSAGRPVVCTPFEYAKAKAQEGPGVILAPGFDASSIVQAIESLAQSAEYAQHARDTHLRTRSWSWNEVGGEFGALYTDARVNVKVGERSRASASTPL